MKHPTLTLLACAVLSCGCAMTITGLDAPPTDDAAPADSPPDVALVFDAADVVDAIVVADAPPLDVPVFEAGACGVDAGAPDAACGPMLCGNGVRDSCSVCNPCGGGGGGPPRLDGGTCCTTVREGCDGADLGGATCTSLGYVSGALACGGGCVLDTSACVDCATGAHVPACTQLGAASVGASSLDVAVAQDGTLGVAWTVPGAGVRFARYDGDLAPLGGPSDCLGPGDASEVALAAVPSGWLLAVGWRGHGPGAVAVLALDPTGRLVGQPLTIADAGVPGFAQRPGDGPLLTWVRSDNALMAAVLRGDGAESTMPAVVLPGVEEPQYCNAVFAGDGFLVAGRDLSGSGGARVVRVELDGRVGPAQQPAGTETEYPQLAWTGTRAVLSVNDFSRTPTIYWAALDRTGHRTGPLVLAGMAPTYYDPAPLVTFGENSLLVLPGYTGGTDMASRLDPVQLDATGHPLYAPFSVLHDPNAATGYRLVRQRDAAVLAWLRSGAHQGVSLARVTP